MKNWIVFGVTAASLSLLASSAVFADYHCKVGETAEAKNDVDVYDSPVKPREKYKNYFIKEGKTGKVLERHEDGWCKLAGVAPDGGEGWVAEDHLQAAGGGSKDSDAEDTNSESSWESDPSMESEPTPAPETETETNEGTPPEAPKEEAPEMGGGGAGGGGGGGDPK
jgi:hypothetical protein